MTVIKPEFEADDHEPKEGDKIEPQLPDESGGDDETDGMMFTSDRTVCTWSDDMEEHRRVFIFDKLADSALDGKILVENMDMVCKWLKDGTIAKERKLKSVKE